MLSRSIIQVAVFYRNRLRQAKNGRNAMWIVLFIVIVLFVLGSALMLLRSAKIPKIPDKVKAQPYEDDE
ncbi:MAG: hypothetical protein Q7U18_10280 [Methylobacter sp.]|nr:hypothetical protein [Methylobacter sp.]